MGANDSDTDFDNGNLHLPLDNPNGVATHQHGTREHTHAWGKEPHGHSAFSVCGRSECAGLEPHDKHTRPDDIDQQKLLYVPVGALLYEDGSVQDAFVQRQAGQQRPVTNQAWVQRSLLVRLARDVRNITGNALKHANWCGVRSGTNGLCDCGKTNLEETLRLVGRILRDG